MQIVSVTALGRPIVPAALIAIAAAAPTAWAQEAPHAWVASPDVYKVIAETDKFRVISATWQPGQVDNPHSHKPLAVYFLDNCTVRIHEGGKTRDGKPKTGNAVTQKPVREHRFENTGKNVCRMVLVEEK